MERSFNQLLLFIVGQDGANPSPRHFHFQFLVPVLLSFENIVLSKWWHR